MTINSYTILATQGDFNCQWRRQNVPDGGFIVYQSG